MFETPPASDDISVTPRLSILPRPKVKNVIKSQMRFEIIERIRWAMDFSSMKPFIRIRIERANPMIAIWFRRSCKFNPWMGRKLNTYEGIIR